MRGGDSAIFCFLAVATCVAAASVRADIVTRDCEVVARDGVRLYTRVVGPGDGARHPCVFKRTPYPEAVAEDGSAYARRGYVEVLQHCRGFGRSGGLCRPYVEREDGLDSLAWIRRQPWYDGEIFLEGASYEATVHLAYLADDPPDVKGAALSVQTDRMYGRNYRNGCCYGFCGFGWWRRMVRREFPDAHLVADEPKRPYADAVLRTFGRDLPDLSGMFLHVDCDSFWRDNSRFDVMPHIRFPILWQGGWWDFYIEGMTSMWERMPAAAKARSAFVLAPRGHSTDALAGTPLAGPHRLRTFSALDFFDSVRTGRGGSAWPCGKLIAYEVGSDVWRTYDWPVSAKNERTFFLGADGSLSEGRAAQRGERSLRYDPRGPRISGLDDSRSQKAWAPGRRSDALEFVSAPFGSETRFFGRPRIVVPARSDCEDTQLFFRIDLMTPEGEAWNVCQTITSFRHARTDCCADETVTLDLTFPLIAFRVARGWSVRLDVTSDGGAYVQHANVAKHWAHVTEDEVRTAVNGVLCGDAKLTLPLAP